MTALTNSTRRLQISRQIDDGQWTDRRIRVQDCSISSMIFLPPKAPRIPTHGATRSLTIS